MEAVVHTIMCIPEQHSEPTTRAITRVEWHIGNTHFSEVNVRNPLLVSSMEHQFNVDILIDMIQERITLKVMVHTLSAFWWQSGLLVIVSHHLLEIQTHSSCAFMPNSYCIVSAFDHTRTHAHTHTHLSIQWWQKFMLCTGLAYRCRYFIDGCEMTSHRFGIDWYSVPLIRNKCLLIINIAWFFKNIFKGILNYRLASLSYNASIPSNRLRGVIIWFTWHSHFLEVLFPFC